MSSTQWIPASRRRRLLAVGIDLMLFSAAWGVVDYCAQLSIPSLVNLPLYVRMAVFAVLESVMYRVWSWSPGHELLAIRMLPAHMIAQPIDAGNPGLIAVVDGDVLSRESWLTILVGVLLINEGAKGVVRWSMWNPPAPFFGFQTDPIASAVLSAAIGLVEIYAGMSFLALRTRALWIGLSVYASELASTILSWNLWDPFVAEMTIRRRAYQGLPVRPGEVEQMQSLMPEVMIAWAVLLVIVMVATWPRLKQRMPNKTLEPTA